MSGETFPLLSVETVTSYTQIAQVVQDWNRLVARAGTEDFYLRPEWLEAVFSFTPDAVGAPRVLLVRNAGELLAVAPFNIVTVKRRRIQFNALRLIGNIYAPRRAVTVLPEYAQAVAMRIAGFLCDELPDSWDFLELQDVHERDAFVGLLAEEFRRRKSAVLTRLEFRSVRATIGAGSAATAYFDGISKNVKQNLRTAINRFRRSGDFSVSMLREPSQQAERFIDSYHEVLGASWKEPEAYPNFHRQLMRRFLPDGTVRLFLLYSRPVLEEGALQAADIVRQGLIPSPILPPDGRCLAACLFMIEGRTAHFLKTSYRNDSEFTSAGAVLFWIALKHLVNSESIETVDFQRGEERYKLDFGKADDVFISHWMARPGNIKAAFAAWIETVAMPCVRSMKRMRMRLYRERNSPVGAPLVTKS